MVHNHSPLEAIVNTPCPFCGTRITVTFNSDGTAFTLNCSNSTKHFTVFQDIETPPPWWQQCHHSSVDRIWFDFDTHWYEDENTLHVLTHGWSPIGIEMLGCAYVSPDHEHYELWRWIVNDSNRTNKVINDLELEELRIQFEGKK